MRHCTIWLVPRSKQWRKPWCPVGVDWKAPGREDEGLFPRTALEYCFAILFLSSIIEVHLEVEVQPEFQAAPDR